ncbi:MAG TPA: twin-arginine translocation pathway signal protein [Candidatus Binatia bacterium]|nr:twin-arginine translocation pathway signal protein [Candidatus Binatia bacterium]
MNFSKKTVTTIVLDLVATMSIAFASPAMAASASDIDGKARAALQTLLATTPGARELARKAEAILVFPSVVKAGLMVGAQYGEGALITGSKTAGYYNIASASYGPQAGVQTFGYALFLMTPEARKYLDGSAG